MIKEKFVNWMARNRSDDNWPEVHQELSGGVLMTMTMEKSRGISLKRV